MTASYSWSYRVSRSVWAAVVNLALWVMIPLLISDELKSFVPSAPVSIGIPFILSFGIPITALQVLAAFSTGTAASVPLRSGSYLAEAYYIWSAAGGGALKVSVQSISVGVAFQPLLFLLMLPSLFASVSGAVGYLLEQSEAGRAAPDEA